jgi:hypothetical protein
LQGLWPKGLKDDVGLEIVQNLIVAKIGESWEVQNRLLFGQLVILVVEDLHLASLDEVHLLDTALVADNSLSRLVNPAIKVDYQLVDESPFTLFEKVIKTSFKLFELESLNNQLSLHLGGHPLIELKFFDHEVIIVQEGLIDVVLDIVVQVGLDMERFVGFLNLLDPHVQRVKLFID